MAFEPVAAPSALIDQVHERLVNAIADGTLPPGQRLTQEEIALRLGVSRQPVSHALQVLRRRGLVEESGKRGLMVAPLDAQKLRGLYQVRAALEALAASLAAARVKAGLISDGDTKEGHAIVARGLKISETDAISDLIDADVAFHSYVHRLSGNDAIAETVAEQWPHFRRSMGMVYSARIAGRIWAEHRDILSGIFRGDADAAAGAARRHIESATEEAVRRLEERQTLS